MKTIHVSGTRKKAIARVTLTEGKGIVRVNSQRIEAVEPALAREKLMEPLVLAGETAQSVDIFVRVSGGGMNSQAEAVRVGISRALVRHDKKLEKVFTQYDRQLLVPDVRQKETHKPNRHGRARAKRQKSYR